MSIVNVSIEELENTSRRFEDTNKEFRKYHIAYLKYTDLSEENKKMAVTKMCDLFKILHDENPKWSFTKVVNFIAAKNQDIVGFSKSKVRKYASTKEIKTLMHVVPRLPRQPKKPKSLPSALLEKFRQEKGKQQQQGQQQGQEEQEQEEESSETNVQNNIIEQRLLGAVKTIVPEESSRIKVQKNAATVSPPVEIDGVIINDLVAIIKNLDESLNELVKENKELKRQYQELEEKYNQVSLPFEIQTSVIVSGQEILLIVKIDPYKITATVEIDHKEVKRLKK